MPLCPPCGPGLYSDNERHTIEPRVTNIFSEGEYFYSNNGTEREGGQLMGYNRRRSSKILGKIMASGKMKTGGFRFKFWEQCV
ncbi:hypothetical protein CDAR_199731 [Caerostris darwini]|uniref:Uncharacterized protein n=1 Tax=Caerostris darwini TaxID=1538125 RepID=A0AAV4SDV2_9ARAC|nr:hypothetical protein CDAR_199731 [Caerostris darwini]